MARPSPGSWNGTRSESAWTDGKGPYTDNIFVQRVWRTVKYEEVYLKAYSNGREAKGGLDDYFRLYTQRPHQALDYRTRAEVFNQDLLPSDEQ